MKQLLACLLLLAISGTAILAKNFDFRSAKWGMNTDNVTQKEGNPVSRNKSGDHYTLGYDKEVAGLKAYTEFKFLKNELGQGNYLFKIKYNNKNDYIYDFKKLRKALIKKYGNPKETNPEIWVNDTHKKDKDSYGLAVGVGHLTYVANWTTGTTKILLKLKGENLKFRLTLTYTSNSYEQKIKELTEAQSSDGL